MILQNILVYLRSSEHTTFSSAMISALPLRWVLLLILPALSHQTSGLFSVNVQSPVSGLLGSSVSLHCDLENNMDARALDVRWYRPTMFDTPVLFYENGQIKKSPVDVQYEGRVFLLGELEKGDVALKLENLILADRGDYMCHVSSDSWYDEATVSLRVRALGSTPVFSSQVAEGGQMKVNCRSHGWQPEPSVFWTDKDGRDLKHLSKEQFSKNSEGLVDVSSWLIVSPSESEWISCSVGLSDHERKESRTTLDVRAGVTESSNLYFIAIPILLLLCPAGIAVYCVLHKKGLILSKRNRTENAEGTQAEIEPLNNIPVENQDQNDISSISTSSPAFVIESRGQQRGSTDKPNFTGIFYPPPPAHILTRPTSLKAPTPAPNTKPTPAENISKPKPSVRISKSKPAETISISTSAETISNLTPAATVSNLTPAATVSDSTPAETISNPTPAGLISKPKPAVRISKSTPVTTVSNPTPAATVSDSTPAETISNPTPAGVISKPKLALRISKSTPAATVSDSTPAGVISKPKPALRISKSTPVATVSNPTPADVISKPKLAVCILKSTPAATVSNPTPSARVEHTSTISDFKHLGMQEAEDSEGETSFSLMSEEDSSSSVPEDLEMGNDGS